MTKDKNFRIEKDSLGEVRVPSEAYYGAFTARALNNFQISNLRAPAVFRKALGLVKKSAAITNTSLKELEPKLGKAIEQAAQEFLEGKFDSEFRLDVIQAGAGTPFNMNANEIIANRANTILKGVKGSNKPVHPNNHVNLGQSSNDLTPSVTKLAILLSLPDLIAKIKLLEKSFDRKSKDFSSITKVGRTHLQDAVTITLGQEFDAYGKALTRARKEIEHDAEDLKELSLGGTAVGTGFNCHPKFKKEILATLSKATGIHLTSVENLTEGANNYSPFAEFANALSIFASNLFRIAMDLKILSSGPNAGLNEINLPATQPGSSIMPGKINPSIPEAVEMTFYKIAGNTETVRLAAMHGQLDLNTNGPIIMFSIIEAMEILGNMVETFRLRCLDGIEANKKHIKDVYNSSVCETVALVPKLGYDKVAEMVKKQKKTNRSS